MSYGGTSDPTGVQVTFLDQTGAKSVKAVIAFTVPVSRIIPNIITKMNLPATSPDGQPMSYALDHKEGGRRLLENWTLVDASVRDGDHLIVYPEVVAG
ncbi:EsaB/YukD family protein [Paludisphaera sp.]|uniref:EsaB/YukD family protein n=1 Tax=Paludisphaera sp. TaxID=2017432 RepID=UPI00301BDDEB